MEDEAWERGRTAWPGVEVDRDRFTRHLRRLGPERVVCVEDLFLAFGCVEGIAAAVARLERDHLGALPRLLDRLGATREEALDVQLHLRHDLLVGRRERRPQLADYAGRSALHGWISVLAVKRLTRLRARKAATEAPGPASDRGLVTSTLASERSIMTAQERLDLEQIQRSALVYLATFERTLIKLDVIGPLSIDDLRRVRRAQQATVASCLAALHRRLLFDVFETLGPHMQLGDKEVEDIVALLCG